MIFDIHMSVFVYQMFVFEYQMSEFVYQNLHIKISKYLQFGEDTITSKCDA